MRSLKSIHRKKEKKRKNRADWERRRNINANVPTETRMKKREIYGQVKTISGKHKMNAQGVPQLFHKDTIEVPEKKKVYRHHEKNDPHKSQVDEEGREIGMIQYPKRKKITQKKEKKT